MPRRNRRLTADTQFTAKGPWARRPKGNVRWFVHTPDGAFVQAESYDAALLIAEAVNGKISQR